MAKRIATLSEIEEMNLDECFRDLADPCVQGWYDRKLIDLILITVCPVICEAESWTGAGSLEKRNSGGCSSFWSCRTEFQPMTPLDEFSPA